MWNFQVVAIFATIIVFAYGGVIPSESANKSENEVDILRLINQGRFEGAVDVDFEKELLLNMIFPSYLKEFFNLFSNESTTSQLPENTNPIIDQLFKNVNNTDCKGQSLEWILRVIIKTDILSKGSNEWVLQMVDAWGKPPEGVLSGHVNAFGDFDECVQIKVKDLDIINTNYKNTSKSFEGYYCTVYMTPYELAMNTTPVRVPLKYSKELSMGGGQTRKAVSFGELVDLMTTPGIGISPSLGTCFPNTCQHSDIQQILVNAFELIYWSIIQAEQNLDDPKLEKVYPDRVLWPSTIACYEQKKPDFDPADYIVIGLISTIAVLCVGSGVIDYWLNHGVDKPPKRGAAYQYFMAFSLYTNTKKWLSTRKSADDLGCLHGIRFLSTAWVVLAHTYYVITFLPQWNMRDVKLVYEDWSVLTVINATYAVDTFFVLSGMLVAYNVYKMLDKTKGKINIPMFYVHRYLRLTPTYAILVGIMATLVPYLGNGPYWAVMTRWGHICEDNWWTNLIYVNNFVNTSWLCQGEAWYLANDMQFYIVSPFIIYPMWRWEMFGMVLLAIYTVMSCAAPALLVHFLDTNPTTLPTRAVDKWFTHIYIRPYARIQTFLVGIWLGWLLHKTKGKRVQLPTFVVILFWLASTAICLTVLYSIQDWFDPTTEIPKVSGLAYAGLSRVGWGVAISWVIFACIKGYGGIINSFLSWSAFMPLGRLCYCVYLVSLHLQMILHVRFTQPIKYDPYTQVNFFFGHMIMAFIVGFICTLLFESPFMILQKLMFEGTGSRPQTQNLANAKRPSKRYGIFYNNADTIINAQVTAPDEKVSKD